MAHKVSKNPGNLLQLVYKNQIDDQLLKSIKDYSVVLIAIPRLKKELRIKNPSDLLASELWDWVRTINLISEQMREGANLLIYSETEITPYIYVYLPSFVKYQTWIEVKTNPLIAGTDKGLPSQHIGLFVTTVGEKILEHNKIRIEYEYCPACGKTTKDYGGRKHLYDSYGTLMSDVWKDLEISRDDTLPRLVVDRVRDMFDLSENGCMLVFTLGITADRLPLLNPTKAFPSIPDAPAVTVEQVFEGIKAGDCLDLLPQVPSGSVSLAFADPPYNLAKHYNSYTDDRNTADYLAWTDKWLAEYVRVLKPGGFLVVINLPILCVRHFLLLEQFPELTRLNWIVWDALSAPRRFIMPANYSILVYAKNIEKAEVNTGFEELLISPENEILHPLEDGYCLRIPCKKNRKRVTKDLSDLWTDIHRVKHNSKRLDHPCLLPPKLMDRIITLFSQKGDIVLDTFNGVGTTTLTAHKLNRRYIGFDKDAEYSEIATNRHRLINQGKDPFEVGAGASGKKNDGSQRMRVQQYDVPKKTIQLAVKQLGIELNHIPTPDDVQKHLPQLYNYCIEYFANWSEVTRACYSTGMSENPTKDNIENSGQQHLL